MIEMYLICSFIEKEPIKSQLQHCLDPLMNDEKVTIIIVKVSLNSLVF